MLFTGIAPGHYMAHISVPGEEGDREQDLDIFGDMTIDADTFSAAGSCSIKGVVRMAEGGPLPTRRIVVSLRSRSGESSRGASLTPKACSISMACSRAPSARYRSETQSYLLDMAASNAKINGRLLMLGGSPAADLAIVLGKGMGKIRGVAKLNRNGLGGTMSSAGPGQRWFQLCLFRRDQSDSDGTFALSRIVPGRYSLLSIEDGWDLEWSRPDVLKPYLAKATETNGRPRR